MSSSTIISTPAGAPLNYRTGQEHRFLADLENIQNFLMEQQGRKVAHRFIYAFGTANFNFRGADADLGFLLRYLRETKKMNHERAKNGKQKMTYIFCIDKSYSGYEGDNLERETFIQKEMREIATGLHSISRENNNMNEPSQKKKFKAKNYDNNNNIIGASTRRKPKILGGARLYAEYPLEPYRGSSTLPTTYTFGSNCMIFFLKYDYPNKCLVKEYPILEKRKKYILEKGLQHFNEHCEPAVDSVGYKLKNMAGRFLQNSLDNELYIYNCAWQSNERMMAENFYFEFFPEVLNIIAEEGFEFKRFFLYYYKNNLFKGEKPVFRRLRPESEPNTLYLAPVTRETDFQKPKRIPEGGRLLKRETRKRR